MFVANGCKCARRHNINSIKNDVTTNEQIVQIVYPSDLNHHLQLVIELSLGVRENGLGVCANTSIAWVAAANDGCTALVPVEVRCEYDERSKN
jgi:hypothetical protein